MNTNSNGLFMHGSRGLHPPPSENSKLSLNFQKIGIGKDLYPRQIIPRVVLMCGWLNDMSHYTVTCVYYNYEILTCFFFGLKSYDIYPVIGPTNKRI